MKLRQRSMNERTCIVLLVEARTQIHKKPKRDNEMYTYRKGQTKELEKHTTGYYLTIQINIFMNINYYLYELFLVFLFLLIPKKEKEKIMRNKK